MIPPDRPTTTVRKPVYASEIPPPDRPMRFAPSNACSATKMTQSPPVAWHDSVVGALTPPRSRRVPTVYSPGANSSAAPERTSIELYEPGEAVNDVSTTMDGPVTGFG